MTGFQEDLGFSLCLCMYVCICYFAILEYELMLLKRKENSEHQIAIYEVCLMLFCCEGTIFYFLFY